MRRAVLTQSQTSAKRHEPAEVAEACTDELTQHGFFRGYGGCFCQEFALSLLQLGGHLELKSRIE